MDAVHYVHLRTTGIPGFGGLNPTMLAEEGYTGGPVQVIRTENRAYLIKLPSGYRMWVFERDIVSHLKDGERNCENPL